MTTPSFHCFVTGSSNLDTGSNTIDTDTAVQHHCIVVYNFSGQNFFKGPFGRGVPIEKCSDFEEGVKLLTFFKPSLSMT